MPRFLTREPATHRTRSMNVLRQKGREDVTTDAALPAAFRTIPLATVNPRPFHHAPDAHEAQAERAADLAARTPPRSSMAGSGDSPSPAQAAPRVFHTPLQRDGGLVTGNLSTPLRRAVHENIASKKGMGTKLPDAVKRTMEAQLGADFSRVRLHTDPHANTLAQSLGANAFTVGRDIFFNEHRYQPERPEKADVSWLTNWPMSSSKAARTPAPCNAT